MDKLYLDTAQLLWNGNAVQNKDNISKFLAELPTSEFQVQSLDTQPLLLGESGSLSLVLWSTFCSRLKMCEHITLHLHVI